MQQRRLISLHNSERRKSALRQTAVVVAVAAPAVTAKRRFRRHAEGRKTQMKPRESSNLNTCLKGTGTADMERGLTAVDSIVEIIGT